MSEEVRAVAVPALYASEAAEVYGPSAGQGAGQIVKIRGQRVPAGRSSSPTAGS